MNTQAHLGDTAGSVQDHYNKASITGKCIAVLLLEKGLSFNLWKIHQWNSIKQSVIKQGVPVFHVYPFVLMQRLPVKTQMSRDG